MTLARAVAVLCIAAAACGCTPGAASGPSSGGARSGAVVVEMSLSKYAPASSPYGTVAAYAPAVLNVARGSTVQFHNGDSFSHTATSAGTAGFPAGNPFPSSALSRSGGDLAAVAWSTGELPGGAYSQALTASTPGTYYYGCYYHYGSPMRGVIVVQ